MPSFGGGLNLRDAPSELENNESPDCMNITLDERGGVVKRLGRAKWNGSQLGAAKIDNAFYSPQFQYLYVQQGTSIYRSNNGTFSAALKTFTTGARISFCDFQGSLVVVHPVDGVWRTTDGTTFTQTAGGTNAMETVLGNTIAAWQNKVWVSGNTAQPSRVYFSANADATTWNNAASGSGTVDIREKDNALVTALAVSEGMDVQGRAGLFVFKEESTYRINSASTGSFTTIDGDYGAAGPLAVALGEGVTVAISRRGIIGITGAGEDHPVLASAKLEPLFSPVQLAYATSANWCAGIRRDRAIFSLARVGSSANNLTLEYSPADGWIVPHDFGASCFATWAKDDDKLFSGHPSAGYIYDTFTTGADDGVAINSRWQSRWFEPSDGYETRMRRLIVNGRGDFSLYVKRNFDTGEGELNTVQLSGEGLVWGTGIWGVDNWGPSSYEDYAEFYSLGLCRSVSFELRHSGTSSATAPKLLDDGVAYETGACALYGLHLDYVSLGAS